MIKIFATGATKTFFDWDVSLDEYLKPGDAIDEKIRDHILNAVPPRTTDADMIQMGEPHDHDGPGYAARYATIQRYGELWFYTGLRVAGERVALMQKEKRDGME